MRGSGVPDKTDGTSVGLFVRRWASTSPSNRSNRQGFWNHAHVSDPRSIVPRLRLDRFGAVERPAAPPSHSNVLRRVVTFCNPTNLTTQLGVKIAELVEGSVLLAACGRGIRKNLQIVHHVEQPQTSRDGATARESAAVPFRRDSVR